ncbi:MAG: dihydroorotate dehydrogenase-like protein [Mucinivorans sp.]
MNRLETRYLGLLLKSPIIVSSSPFTANLENIKKAEAAGAGAVVVKSIFEEQILSEIVSVDSYADYPEAADYLKSYIMENSLGLYLELIQAAKHECRIPIIASINCTAKGDWINFARVMENAGADALELNIFQLPTNKELSSEQIQKNYLEIVAMVRDAVTIPVSVKLAQNFTNPLEIVRELYYRNIKGVVLFNRFYTPDIDIEQRTMTSGGVWSGTSELGNVIRWSGLVSGNLPLVDVAASSGVHTGEDAVKVMLSGAKAVQVCTALHNGGYEAITAMNLFIDEWMRRSGFEQTTEFIGHLSSSNVRDTKAYERTQFMRYFSNISE